MTIHVRNLKTGEQAAILGLGVLLLIPKSLYDPSQGELDEVLEISGALDEIPVGSVYDISLHEREGEQAWGMAIDVDLEVEDA